MSSNHNETDAQVNSQRMCQTTKTLHRSKLHKVPGMCGKWTWVSIPNKDGICNLYLPEMKNLFPVME